MCLSCGEEMPRGECTESHSSCGHHCDCSWIHDRCCWCGLAFGEEPGEFIPMEERMTLTEIQAQLESLKSELEDHRTNQRADPRNLSIAITLVEDAQLRVWAAMQSGVGSAVGTVT